MIVQLHYLYFLSVGLFSKAPPEVTPGSEFERIAESLLENYKKPVECSIIEEGHTKSLRIKATGATLERIRNEIEKKGFQDQSYHQLEIDVVDSLVINTTLKLPGKNLVISCPQIYVSSIAGGKLNLSGLDHGNL